MIYVFDTSSFRELFRHFYQSRFPTLWDLFSTLVNEGQIISVREVLNEVKAKQGERDLLYTWSKSNRQLFLEPTEDEIGYVKTIMNHNHFRHIIPQKSILSGKPVADPFLAAKAKSINGILITQELLKPNGAKLPNVCDYLEAQWTNLEGFMEKENWVF